MKTSRFALLAIVWTVLSGTLTVYAHTEQQQPSHVLLYPHQSYVTALVSGDRNDLSDAVSSDAHSSTIAASTNAAKEKDAKHYVETHLFFEQGGQVLPVHANSVRFFDTGGEQSQRFEMFLRVDRPIFQATTPLTVASDLFSGLGNARTLVVLGQQEKEIVGRKEIDFAAATTRPTLTRDTLDFAQNGVVAPLQIGQFLLLVTLLLGASLASTRHFVAVLLASVLGGSLSFLLDLMSGLHVPVSWSGGGIALCVVLAGVVSWWLSKRTASSSQFNLLPLLAFVGSGFAATSFAAPLRAWGLPESHLFVCGLAFVIGLALTQAVIGFVVSLCLTHWKRKFTHQATYGGMNWPRVVQIASLGCTVLGGLYAVQGFPS